MLEKKDNEEKRFRFREKTRPVKKYETLIAFAAISCIQLRLSLLRVTRATKPNALIEVVLMQAWKENPQNKTQVMKN